MEGHGKPLAVFESYSALECNEKLESCLYCFFIWKVGCIVDQTK